MEFQFLACGVKVIKSGMKHEKIIQPRLNDHKDSIEIILESGLMIQKVIVV